MRSLSEGSVPKCFHYGENSVRCGLKHEYWGWRQQWATSNVCLWEGALIPWWLFLEIWLNTESQVRIEVSPLKMMEENWRIFKSLSLTRYNLFHRIWGSWGNFIFVFCLFTVLSILKYSLGNQLQKCFKASVCLLTTAKHMDSCCWVAAHRNKEIPIVVII